MVWRRGTRSASLGMLALAAALGLAGAAGAAPARETQLVSRASNGAPGNSNSSEPSVSASGRYVAFASFASNLDPPDLEGFDIYVRDRERGATERASISSSGAPAEGVSLAPSISADGRFVAFESDAANLVAGDTNGHIDVFVHDRLGGRTERVSVASDGTQGNSLSESAAIDGRGRFVAFESAASNLVPGDGNGETDVFVHDRLTGATQRVSVSSAGVEGDSNSFDPAISGDGRLVAFTSNATNLVPGDSNGAPDVFLHDRRTGTTQRVSVTAAGKQLPTFSGHAALNANGRFVAFESFGAIVPGDPGGTDVYVRDLRDGSVERASVSSTGAGANDEAFAPDISPDGRYVTFLADATNLVPGDSNGFTDVFVHDRRTGATLRASVGRDGRQANANSFDATVANGAITVFGSFASDLVPRDGNRSDDVFVHRSDCTDVGTRGPDLLQGTSGADVICGAGGDDTLIGGAGDDVLVGGPGADDLQGGAGDDALDGRDGVARNDVLDGGPGTDVCSADRGDTLSGCP